MSYGVDREESIPTDDVRRKTEGIDSEYLGFGLGRGRFLRQPHLASFTPVRGTGDIDSPGFCSTRIQSNTSRAATQSSSDIPIDGLDMNSPGLGNLITQIAQQVGQSISDQLRREGEKEGWGAHAQSIGAGQPITDSSSLNLTGVKLVMQSDVREPPCFRGDGSDKHSVQEWEELMDVYLRKKGVPLREQHQEIASKLMGNARDIVKITLRNNPSLKPDENPKAIIGILKQHFSEVTYSSMPLADFYGTVPVAGENVVEYWIRLNKAVDMADECLKREGRCVEEPSREVTRMFIKHCPDPSLAAVLKFKGPDKWTASEIQERIDDYQSEMKAQSLTKPRRSTAVKQAAVYVQTPTPEDVVTASCPVVPPVRAEVMSMPSPQLDGNCMQVLVSLLDRALSQNNQTAVGGQRSFNSAERKPCKVCKSTEHSTLAHCRRDRLCLACFEPGHYKRDCQKHNARWQQQVPQPSQLNQ